MKLIAEAGTNKCDWALLEEGKETRFFYSEGLNPVQQSAEQFRNIVASLEFAALYADEILEIRFFGAGCTLQYAEKAENILIELFSNAQVFVNSDMLGAALSVYEGEPILVCISGTGSNTSYYDGESLFRENPALGYILGDEGSGTDIGKQLLKHFLYRSFPADLQESFQRKFPNLPTESVIESIYRKEKAAAFLASFVPFAAENVNHPFIHKLLKDKFMNFIEIHILAYENANHLKICFVGSIGFVFRNVWTECLLEKGLKLGKFLQKPILGLAEHFRIQ